MGPALAVSRVRRPVTKVPLCLEIPPPQAILWLASKTFKARSHTDIMWPNLPSEETEAHGASVVENTAAPGVI